MTIVITILSMIVLIGIVVLVIIMAAGALTEALAGLWDRWAWKHEEVIRRNAGRYIARQAYWFSEDAGAMEALNVLGKAMCENGFEIDISHVRDDWRKAKEKWSTTKSKP